MLNYLTVRCYWPRTLIKQRLSLWLWVNDQSKQLMLHLLSSSALIAQTLLALILNNGIFSGGLMMKKCRILCWELHHSLRTLYLKQATDTRGVKEDIEKKAESMLMGVCTADVPPSIPKSKTDRLIQSHGQAQKVGQKTMWYAAVKINIAHCLLMKVSFTEQQRQLSDSTDWDNSKMEDRKTTINWKKAESRSDTETLKVIKGRGMTSVGDI